MQDDNGLIEQRRTDHVATRELLGIGKHDRTVHRMERSRDKQMSFVTVEAEVIMTRGMPTKGCRPTALGLPHNESCNATEVGKERVDAEPASAAQDGREAFEKGQRRKRSDNRKQPR